MTHPATSDAARTTTTLRGTNRSGGASSSGSDGSPGTPTSAGMLVRLGGRQHVLALQRRRFWRELGFAAATLAADALTVAVVFVVLAQLPIPLPSAQLEFVHFLIPSTPQALLRRVTSLVFCLAATRSYSTSSMGSQTGRIGIAIVLGVVLPRWPELWTASIVARSLLLGGVVVALLVALVAQRRAMAGALQSYDPRRLDQERTLLVGVAPQIRTFLAEHIDPTLDPPAVYVLEPEWPGDQQEGWHKLYEEVHRSKSDAIILIGPFSDEALQNVLIAGSAAGCRVFGLRRRPLREMNNPTLIRRGEGPISLLSSPALLGWQLVAKRTLDVSGAIAGLILLSPLLVLSALVVKLTSRGPVFFRQRRVGLGGETFEMLKLRTMVRDADERAPEMLAANVYGDPRLFKATDDPRITPIGRFLRRSSLDELPQLWNVLRGEMSLVGPRPPLPREVTRYQTRHYVRFEVAPGITGPWQVGGRNDITDFEAIVDLEQRYIAGWTVWRDLALLLRTIPAVLSMRGAL
ncbi:MAG TPA: exopolysaccharide biosynthesis polyprenyl glycosylphosphotransferase [Gemmatimonadaceae bacterium]